MKINIIVDNSLNVNVEELTVLLNAKTKLVKFNISRINIEWEEDHINFPETHIKIYKHLTKKEKAFKYNFLFTNQPYLNNYFYEAYLNLVPVSLYDWSSLTNLPLENGILYFIICFLAAELQVKEYRHYKNTGCIYDFLGKKSGVDIGMRSALFCEKCLSKIQNSVLTLENKNILSDVSQLMNLLSNSSKFNNNILEEIVSILPISNKKRTAINNGIINVVIASPSDLIDERQYLFDKLERKFRLSNHETTCKHRLIVHGWEDLASQTGYAQDVINETIIKKMDIVLAVFKHKLGTPTINHNDNTIRTVSGTAEELLMALNSKDASPLAMSYFYSIPPNPSLETDNYEKIVSEWNNLKLFKQTIQQKIIHKPFITKDELLDIVCEDLMKNILDLFVSPNNRK